MPKECLPEICAAAEIEYVTVPPGGHDAPEWLRSTEWRRRPSQSLHCARLRMADPCASILDRMLTGLPAAGGICFSTLKQNADRTQPNVGGCWALGNADASDSYFIGAGGGRNDSGRLNYALGGITGDSGGDGALICWIDSDNKSFRQRSTATSHLLVSRFNSDRAYD